MYRRSRQTAWRTIADETVLLDLEKKQMYGLNPAAAFVWQTLEAMEDVDGVLQALSRYGATPAIGRAELEAFVEELLDLGLMEEAAPAEPPAAAGDPPADLEAPADAEPPRILWHEEVEQIAGTCAFLPAMNPLCTQAPFA